MTQQADAFLAQRLEWVFRRSSRSGSSLRLFGDLPEQARTALRARATLDEGEVPVLGAWDPVAPEMVLLTSRALWLAADTSDARRIAHEELAAVDLVRGALHLDTRGKGITRLRATLRNGDHVPIATDGGPGSLGLLSVLQSLIR